MIAERIMLFKCSLFTVFLLTDINKNGEGTCLFD